MPARVKRNEPVHPQQGGWTIELWCPATTMSRTAVYGLFGTPLEPKSVKIGQRRIIVVILAIILIFWLLSLIGLVPGPRLFYR